MIKKEEQKWIKCPRCNEYFMPPNYDRCDACLLIDYYEILGWGRHDSLDHLGMNLMYEEERVFLALRKAEHKGKKLIKKEVK